MTGIDMLTVFLPPGSFQVDRLSVDRGWTLQRTTTPKVPELPVLYVDRSGPVRATKAHFNAMGVPGSPSFDLNPFGLRVSFNPSKALHPYELSGSEVLPEAIDRVQSAGRSIGLDFDPGSARLSRVDLTRQSEMAEPLSAYNQVWDHLHGPRRNRATRNPGSFRIGNGQAQTEFYWKRAELLAHQKNTFGCPDRLLRAEVRLLKHEKTTKALQATFLAELCHMGQSDLTRAYTGYLGPTVFRVNEDGRSIGQTLIPFPTLAGLFRSAGRAVGYRTLFGAERVIQVHGGLEGYLLFLEEMGVSERTRFREKSVVTRSLDLLAQAEDTTTTTGTLLNELKTKFLAA